MSPLLTICLPDVKGKDQERDGMKALFWESICVISPAGWNLRRFWNSAIFK
jgi:hypothetical protein